MDVFIATPSYDEWLCMEYVSSLTETAVRLTHANIGLYHAIAPGNPFLDLARNGLVEQFLKSPADTLLFIDADVGWDAKVVGRILSYKQGVVGGLVPKRNLDDDHCYHQNACTGVITDNLLQAKELPTAFMAIKRWVFEKLKKPYFKIGSTDEDFGEDIYFCRRLLEAGEFCWIDPDITFTHRGSKPWKGNFYDHAVNTGLLKKPEAA